MKNGGRDNCFVHVDQIDHKITIDRDRDVCTYVRVVFFCSIHSTRSVYSREPEK